MWICPLTAKLHKIQDMNTLSAILWNPDIEIFSIFGISIRYYSVLFVTGLSLAYWVIYKLYQDQKIPYEKFDSLFVYCLLGIVIVLAWDIVCSMSQAIGSLTL